VDRGGPYIGALLQYLGISPTIGEKGYTGEGGAIPTHIGALLQYLGISPTIGEKGYTGEGGS